ncbi:hypothetical protein COOONC_19648 [Cooperia oncophora]
MSSISWLFQVAYFDVGLKQCRFTSDTSQSPRLPCSNIHAIEMKEGIAVLDKVKRYCMQCRHAVMGGSSREDERDSLKQVHSNRGQGRTDSFSPFDAKSLNVRHLPRRPLDIIPPTRRKIMPQTLSRLLHPISRQAPTYPPKTRNISRQLSMNYGNTAKRTSNPEEVSFHIAGSTN